MFVYIDESGIHRPTGYSVFAAVFIETEFLSEIEACVNATERDLEISSFHWAESSWPVKRKFYQGIAKLPFTFITEAFSNPIKPEAALKQFLRHVLSYRTSDTVYIDGTKPRWYASSLKNSLRNYRVSIQNIRLLSDKQAAGLRIADFVAGAIRIYTDGSRHTDLQKMYRGLLKHQTPSGEGVR